MGIKRKKSGPTPMYPHRWQELAKSPDRMDEARREYRELHPSVSLVEAYRAVADFAREHRRKFG